MWVDGRCFNGSTHRRSQTHITRRVLRVLHWGAARPIEELHVPNRRPRKVVRLRALWLRVLRMLRVL